jgi:curved DNA binding protein
MSDSEDSHHEEEEDTEISNPEVFQKYMDAGDIANRTLTKVTELCTAGKSVLEICTFGDNFINEQLTKVYKAKNIEKGVAFPTCISVNNCVGHFSPLVGDTTVLAAGDLVKIDLGVQIDGFISMTANTVVVGGAVDQVTGRKADLLLAAHYAGELVHRLVKPGKKNTDVTEMIAKVGAEFKVNPVEGVLSHQIKRYIVDGNKVIINKETLENKVEEFEFEENEVYCVDILYSTGEGKSKEAEAKTTVYKRAVDVEYNLKLKASREAFNEINKKFPTFPFTMRALDEKKGRLGISEMLKHDLLHTYPVLFEKNGEFVSQVKFTVLVTPSQSLRLNPATPVPTYVQSENKLVTKELTELLSSGTKRAKKNKKKSAAKTAAPVAATTTTTTAPAKN